MRALITGGTGLIGSAVCKTLIKKYPSIEIIILTRNSFLASKNNISYVNSFSKLTGGFDIIINLAGEPINKGRWTDKQKAILLSSRLNITNQLVEYTQRKKQKPQVFISGSAIGFYGSDEQKLFSEDALPSELNFAHKLCNEWEKSANAAKALGIRVVNLRTGIVLAKNGGILKEMLLPFKFGFGCKISDGSAWMSWIHIEDLCRLIMFIIENQAIEGPVNATSPNPTQNKEFSLTLAKILTRPLFLTMPKFSVKLLFGEMGENLFLRGQKVVPTKLMRAGFVFEFPELAAALQNILVLTV